jgi:hypothetical protein
MTSLQVVELLTQLPQATVQEARDRGGRAAEALANLHERAAGQ